MAQGDAVQRIVFFWNNFGPMHADRVDAVAKAMGDGIDCIGLEFRRTDETYDWLSESRESFRKETLFAERIPGFFGRLRALIGAARRLQADSWFLCHYERPEVLCLALYLRLSGRRVFTMGCSKFDDYPRNVFREWLKSVFMRPYHGAISSERRSAEYIRFLGLRKRPVVAQYNTLSVSRIRAAAAAPPAPDGTAFGARDFIIVARFVPKKNLPMALDAFARYVALRPASARKLHLCGSGAGEAELRSRVAALGLTDRVVFHGFLQSEGVARVLAQGLALILPSIEEQFGNVVIEAQAMGLPVLISDVAGARDALVRNWQNGFVFEPDNPEALARFMALLDEDETLWRRLCAGASASAPLGDVAAFASAVQQLLPQAPRA